VTDKLRNGTREFMKKMVPKFLMKPDRINSSAKEKLVPIAEDEDDRAQSAMWGGSRRGTLNGQNEKGEGNGVSYSINSSN